jgi:hypothetical protein
MLNVNPANFYIERSERCGNLKQTQGQARNVKGWIMSEVILTDT